jgi:light-regulated signal transduction histidine kinase (bacteriophytochrome)
MAIVKKILDRHGATVEVRSKPGEGTTFRIRFRKGGDDTHSDNSLTPGNPEEVGHGQY